MEERTTKFIAEYFHKGAWWTVEFFALDFEDAEIICLAHNLKLLGEHMITIPAVTGSWLPTLIIRVSNTLKELYERRKKNGDPGR